jgi:hypothetical protein
MIGKHMNDELERIWKESVVVSYIGICLDGLKTMKKLRKPGV